MILRFLTITSAARRSFERRRRPMRLGRIPGSAACPRPRRRAAHHATLTEVCRCWHRASPWAASPGHPEICARCAGNIGDTPETRRLRMRLSGPSNCPHDAHAGALSLRSRDRSLPRLRRCGSRAISSCTRPSRVALLADTLHTTPVAAWSFLATRAAGSAGHSARSAIVVSIVRHLLLRRLERRDSDVPARPDPDHAAGARATSRRLGSVTSSISSQRT